jgi:Ca2+-binding EF-hand superfamily protein
VEDPELVSAKEVKMKRIAASIAFALLVFTSTVADAQQSTAPSEVTVAFTETDSNGDGVIEIDEYYRRLVDVFFLGDANRDGYLTEDEFVKVVLQKEDFAELDKSQEGKLSKREFIAARLPVYLVIDTDDDGVLSLSEVTAAYEGRVKK